MGAHHQWFRPDQHLVLQEHPDQTPESFDQMIGVNLTSEFNGISTCARRMRERGRAMQAG